MDCNYHHLYFTLTLPWHGEVECKMGEMLAVKPNPGTLLRGDMMSVRENDIPTLADLGVTSKESERAQITG